MRKHRLTVRLNTCPTATSPGSKTSARLIRAITHLIGYQFSKLDAIIVSATECQVNSLCGAMSPRSRSQGPARYSRFRSSSTALSLAEGRFELNRPMQRGERTRTLRSFLCSLWYQAIPIVRTDSCYQQLKTELQYRSSVPQFLGYRSLPRCYR
ncbi:hypothetical protein Pla100_61010 [Neorhodopirellula pilleata]|uniref:Uncharacterized protein n=1 Tax=Neorhodopirellula pilleata TaxID=2714738 RepID=A0A5C5ZGE8_9BACT|nr:hypothetical protein Pla100_61010 [Neorhodopirellula pilleata]